MSTLHNNDLKQLETDIALSEQKTAGLIRGTEKKFVWAKAYEQTDIAIVYIHGFSASRQEISPVCERIAEALDANLFYTRLEGHGCHANAMKTITSRKLLQDAADAIAIGNRLGKKLIVISNSTGGSLACSVLANTAPDSIAALILLSPNFGLKSPMARVLSWPGKSLWLRLLKGPTFTFDPQNDAQANFWTTSYPSRALLPMVEVIASARHAPLHNITAPTLMLYCKQDQLLDINAMLSYFALIGAAQKQVIDYDSVGSSQQHVLAGDILSPQTNEQVIGDVLQFLKTYLT